MTESNVELLIVILILLFATIGLASILWRPDDNYQFPIQEGRDRYIIRSLAGLALLTDSILLSFAVAQPYIYKIIGIIVDVLRIRQSHR